MLRPTELQPLRSSRLRDLKVSYALAINERFKAMPQLSLAVSEAGFYIFPNFSYYRKIFAQKNIHSSLKMSEDILVKCGLACSSGSAFGRPENGLTARFVYTYFDETAALEALQNWDGSRLTKEFIQQHCPRIITAISKLENYLKI